MKSSVRHILAIVAAGAAVAALSACLGGTFSVKATRLTVVERSDTLRGDEPYLGMIRFKSQFGEASSTEVVVHDELRTFGDQVRPGTSVAIPDLVGDISFGAAFSMSRDDVFDDGQQPGVAGVIYVAMDEDHGGKAQVRDDLRETAGRLRSVLVRHVEQVPWIDSALPSALKHVNDELAGSPAYSASSRRGDDYIGRAAAVYVGIEDGYFHELLPIWQDVARGLGSQWHGCDDASNPVCPIGTRPQVLTLDGPGDGSYRLSLEATFDTGSGG
ncbi:hypothetical protein [Sorangium sp. So ce131]|uniref:hypothetical protein n=1 Tax=Sorangium sp. So ce131 TaxID=3133282 RepID=UPI003F61B6D2